MSKIVTKDIIIKKINALVPKLVSYFDDKKEHEFQFYLDFIKLFYDHKIITREQANEITNELIKLFSTM